IPQLALVLVEYVGYALGVQYLMLMVLVGKSCPTHVGERARTPTTMSFKFVQPVDDSFHCSRPEDQALFTASREGDVVKVVLYLPISDVSRRSPSTCTA